MEATSPACGPARATPRTNRRALLGALAVTAAVPTIPAHAESDRSELQRLGDRYEHLRSVMDLELNKPGNPHLDASFAVLDDEYWSVAQRICDLPAASLTDVLIKVTVAADFYNAIPEGGEYQADEILVAAMLRSLAPANRDRYWLERVR